MDNFEKIFNRSLDFVNVGLSDIELYSREEIEDVQNEYRYLKRNGEKNKSWIGEEYVVIGIDTCCGDPIIAKVDDEKIPIYYMMHGISRSLELISDSFDNFMKILELIESVNLLDFQEIEQVLLKIQEIVPAIEVDKYWRVLLQTGYDFLISE